MFSLLNKTVLITGAGSGIGKATSLMLSKMGANILLADINRINAETVKDEIFKNGGTAEIIIFNVALPLEVKIAFSQIKKLDILINCAGISHIGTAENTTEKDFENVYHVNVKGTFNCIHEAIPIMKLNGGGVIINISSIAAKVGLSERFAYSMSKGAIYSMTLSVAKDYIQDHIRCNCISPARVHTPFVDDFISKNFPGKENEVFENLSKSQPIGRMGSANEMAALLLYLCSDEAAFVTGSDFPIDGGFVTLNN